jgi:hypothetical protein
MIKFAVHHCFDCLDYNEHHYFQTSAGAEWKFKQLVDKIRNSDNVDSVYTDTEDEFYVQLSDGLEKVYIEQIKEK